MTASVGRCSKSWELHIEGWLGQNVGDRVWLGWTCSMTPHNQRRIQRDGCIDIAQRTVKASVDDLEASQRCPTCSKPQQRLQRHNGPTRAPVGVRYLRLVIASATRHTTMRAYLKPFLTSRRFLGTTEQRECLPRPP